MELVAPKKESLLRAYAPVREALEQVKLRFDAEIRSPRPHVNGLCEQIRRYSGKMLRPALLLLTGKAVGELNDDHVILGAVVEMVHIATLVHDDVLDQADVRRRQSTVNRMSGNEAAVLLGDYLISHAFHLCCSMRGTDAAREIGATTNMVCEGELTQIKHRGNSLLTESEYIDIISSKTGVLTGTCCALGARFSGATGEIVDELRHFGTEIGIAFQIIDDLLDLAGAEDQVGKTLGRDLDLGKPTLPVIHAFTEGDPGTRARLAELMHGTNAERTPGIKDVLDRSGSMAYAHGIARDYVQSALRRLEALPDSDAKSSLAAMAEFVLRRDH